MSLPDRVVGTVTTYSVPVVLVMLLLTAGMAAGMTQLDQSTGLDQFSFDSDAEQAQSYVGENFSVDEDTTTAQVVLREDDGDVLTRESFVQTIELQQDLRDDEEINETLADEPFADLGTIVATAAIQRDQADGLESQRAELEELGGQLSDDVNETIGLQRQYDELNASYAAGEVSDEEYQQRSADIESQLAGVEDRSADRLDDEQFAAFAGLLDEARSIQSEMAAVEGQYQRGEISEAERDQQLATLESQLEGVYGGIQSEVLAEEFASLQERAEAIEDTDPSLEAQRQQLESMSDDEVESLVDEILSEDGNGQGAFVFVPTDYEVGSVETDARTLYVTQTTDEEIVEGEAPERIVDSQLRMAGLVDDRFGDGAFVFGAGIVSDEFDRSMTDSIAIVLPLAFLFVVLVLTLAYRDLLDILLGMVGIAMVLLWTFGFMGWTGISFNQIMIAVPVLLVGLSIDYAIHVFMRHREQRTADADGSRDAMNVVLLGLGAALVWVTITAVIGFLSNLVSPLGPIQDFGLASAFGIAATFLIFGTFVPAAKVVLDEFLEARGYDRQKRAFGTGGGAFSRFLASGKTAAQRAPLVVLAIALLLTAGGAYGATQVDTSFQQEDFIADDPPDWMQSLPGPFAAGEYTVKSQLDFVNERFLRQDTQTQVLIRGDVTDDRALERIAEAEDSAADEDVVVVLSNGEADVRSPLAAMQALAERDEEFAEAFEEAGADGADGVPDQNLEQLYDAYFEAAPEEAAQTIHRTEDGEYRAVRMQISMQGDATSGDASDATERVADELRGDGIEATATGQLVVFNVIEQELFSTVIDTLIVTFVAVFAFLMVAYRFVHGSAMLGAVTLTPILLAVAWILGTMYVLGISFNFITGTITSLTIGLGVAYNIHISERYRLELSRGHDGWEALHRAVTGTGGALLGSAGTTVGGFGVLAFAILPPLQQFGIITGITIVYAFLGSVFVLPSLLVLWTKYLGPADVLDREPAAEGTTPTTDE